MIFIRNNMHNNEIQDSNLILIKKYRFKIQIFLD